MILLEKKKNYLLRFLPILPIHKDFSYDGPGTYTGKTMTDLQGNTLYWFEDLTENRGFTKSGWFSIDEVISTEDSNELIID
jgi:hypothetical protein